MCGRFVGFYFFLKYWLCVRPASDTAYTIYLVLLNCLSDMTLRLRFSSQRSQFTTYNGNQLFFLGSSFVSPSMCLSGLQVGSYLSWYLAISTYQLLFQLTTLDSKVHLLLKPNIIPFLAQKSQNALLKDKSRAESGVHYVQRPPGRLTADVWSSRDNIHCIRLDAAALPVYQVCGIYWCSKIKAIMLQAQMVPNTQIHLI